MSSIMLHITWPFVANEWIKTKIDGYEVSGTVEVGNTSLHTSIVHKIDAFMYNISKDAEFEKLLNCMFFFIMFIEV